MTTESKISHPFPISLHSSSADPPSPPLPDWLAHLWYKIVYVSSMTGFTLGFSLRYEGKQHVPRDGPVLLIANHQSFFDPVLVGLAAPRQLCYLARKTLFRHRLFATLIRSLRAVPIDQEGLGKDGIRTVLGLLNERRAVLVFPEGERTPDGTMQPLRPGIHLLIKKAPVPIVPVAIAGAFDAWPRWRPLPVPAPLFLPPGKGTIAVSVRPALDAKRLLELPRDRCLELLDQELKLAHARAEHLRRKPMT